MPYTGAGSSYLNAMQAYKKKRGESVARGQRAAAARQALAGQARTASPYTAALQTYAEADRFRASGAGAASGTAQARPAAMAAAPTAPRVSGAAAYAEADRYRPAGVLAAPAVAAPARAAAAPRTTNAAVARAVLASPESRFETGVPVAALGRPQASTGASSLAPTIGPSPTDRAEAARAALLAERMAALQTAQTGTPPAPPPQVPPGAAAAVTAPPGTGAAAFVDTSGTQRFSLEAIYNKLNAPVGSPEGYATQEEWNQARAFLREAAERGNADARRLLGYTDAPGTEGATGETETDTGPELGETDTGGGGGGGAERERDGSASLTQISNEVKADLQSLAQMGNEQIAEMNSLFAGLLQRLEQSRQELVARAERDARQLDPATQLALDTLRQDLEEGLRAAKEEANRRGILDSGIAIGMGLKARGSGARAEAVILSDRARRLQDSLEQGLRRIEDQTFGVALEHARAVPEARFRLFDTFQRAREAGRGRIDTERRFGVQTGLQREGMREGQRQFNIGAAADLSAAYGFPVYPKMGGEQLFEQLEGRESVAAQQARAALARANQGEAAAKRREEEARQQADVVSEIEQATSGASKNPRTGQPWTREELLEWIRAQEQSWYPATILKAYEALNRRFPQSQDSEELSYND